MRLRYDYKEADTTRVKSARTPRVRDLMSTELFTLFKDDSLKQLKDIFDLKMIRHVPIIDDSRQLVGLVSQRDFLKYAVSKLAPLSREEESEIYSRVRISEIMGKRIMTVSPDTPLAVAAATMLEHKYGCLPVIEGDRLVGIITEADFVEAFVRY